MKTLIVLMVFLYPVKEVNSIYTSQINFEKIAIQKQQDLELLKSQLKKDVAILKIKNNI